MTKVVRIDNGKPLQVQGGEPDPVVVDFLEQLLARARSGDLVGIAAVYEYGEQMLAWHLIGSCNMVRMVGGLEILKTKAVEQVESDE